MQQKDDEENKKAPIEMTTDEALDYVFGDGDSGQTKTGNGQDSRPRTLPARRNGVNPLNMVENILFRLTFNLSTQTLNATGTFTVSIDPSSNRKGAMDVRVTSP